MIRTRSSLIPTYLFAMASLIASPGCMTLPVNLENKAGGSLVPTRHKLECWPYVVYTNTPLAVDSPEVRQLVKLEDQLRASLSLEIDRQQNPIEIYILDDRSSFNHFLTFYYSELPPRRAFFFAQGNRRVIYTFHGKSLEQDLRHEATHALLHAAAKDLPLWLDEGLSEYFEVDGSLHGVNSEHLGKLRTDVKEGWSPDLSRLESLTDVREMGPRDYREAWAWTHYFLSTSPQNKQTLLSYLKDRASERQKYPLMERLGDPKTRNEAVLAHVVETRATMMANTRGSKHETFRFQNDPLVQRASTERQTEPQDDTRGPFRVTLKFFERVFSPLRRR